MKKVFLNLVAPILNQIYQNKYDSVKGPYQSVEDDLVFTYFVSKDDKEYDITISEFTKSGFVISIINKEGMVVSREQI